MGLIFGMVVICLLCVIVVLLITRRSLPKTDLRYSVHKPPTGKQQIVQASSPSIEKNENDADIENASPSIEMSDAQSDMPPGMEGVNEGTKITGGMTAGNDNDIVAII